MYVQPAVPVHDDSSPAVKVHAGAAQASATSTTSAPGAAGPATDDGGDGDGDVLTRQVRLVQQVLVEFEAPGVQTVDLEHVGGFQFIEQVALCSHGQSSRIKNS